MASPEFPPPYRRSSGTRTVVILLLLVGLAVGTFIVCAGVIGFQVYRQVQARLEEEQRSIELPPPEIESLDAKREAVTAAFGSDDAGVADSELEDIHKLFDAVVRASSEGDQTAHRRLIDFDRMLLQIKRSGHLTSLTAAEEKALRQEIETSLGTAADWQRYEIVHVDPIAANERVAYGWFWNGSDHLFETRYWIVRFEGRWKVYDWELLQFGVRESAEWAIYWKHAADPQYEALRKVDLHLETADRLIAEGLYAEAAMSVRQAESQRPVPELAGKNRVRIAFAWARCDRSWEFLQACQQLENPESAPGVLYGAAAACLRLSRYAEALDYANQFEAAVGRSPNAHELRAEALTYLGRTAEAAREWEQFVRSNPDDVVALQSLGRTLPADQKAVLTECVLRASDPAGTAVTLAEHFSGWYDVESVNAMVAVVERHDPESARWNFVQGLARQTDEDYEAAAALFLQAYSAETDREVQNRYLYYYLFATTQAGQPLDAYRNAPDPASAFLYLTDAYDRGEWGVTRETVEGLMEMHRERAPDDPWIVYYTGLFLAEDGEHDAAADVFSTGMVQTEDENILATFRYRLLAALFEAGRGLEAYRTVEPPAEAFRQLAGLCRWNEDFALLAELVKEHTARQPGDEMLDLYRAILLMEEKDYRQAARILERGQSNAEDEQVQTQYRNLRLEARLRAGETLAAYREIGPPREAFSYLAELLTADENWSTLKSLLRRHRSAQPTDPQWAVVEADMHWQRKDYPALIRLLSPWPPASIGSLDEWNRSQLAERLIRSYLRSNRVDEALAEAQVISERGYAFPLLLVHTWSGDVARVQELMELVSPTGSLARSLYYDEDAAEIAFSDEFLPLRRRWPPAVPYNIATRYFVLLCREAAAQAGPTFQDRLASALPDDAAVTSLDVETAGPMQQSFLVRTSEAAVCVTVGRDHYLAKPQPIIGRLSNDVLRQAVADHGFWIAIDGLAANENFKHDAASAELAGRVAAAMCDADCLAAYFADAQRLAVNAVEVRQAFTSDDPAEALSQLDESLSESIGLYRGVPDDPHEAEAIRKCRLGLKQFATAFAGNSESSADGIFRVQYRIQVGHASETHWLAVEQIEPGLYSGRRFIGELTTDSQLDPRLKAGEPFAIEDDQVIDWAYTQGGQTHRGRDDKSPAL